MSKARYSLFGGQHGEREQLAKRLDAFALHVGPGAVSFGLLLLGETGPEPLELRARVLELSGAPLFVLGPHRLDFAVRAAQLGAADYFAVPLDTAALTARLCAAPMAEPVGSRATAALVGTSAAMARVRAQIELYGKGSEPVLVLGESGTGKELVARAIHFASPRQALPFHAINCSTIVDTLAESELFGARRGAYTGAAVNRAGLFEAAHKSTLFLDEVATASPALQAKLLRVLESGEFFALGSNAALRVDVRVLAATNANLLEARADKQFRRDLYYRLAGTLIELPPLRERIEDLPALVAHHLALLAKRLRRSVPQVEPEVFARLRAHGWPGNVRELIHVLANAMNVCEPDLLRASDLPRFIAGDDSALEPYDAAKRSFDRAYVDRLMRMTSGNVSEAARIAGRTRKDMYKLFERAGLDASRFRSD